MTGLARVQGLREGTGWCPHGFPGLPGRAGPFPKRVTIVRNIAHVAGQSTCKSEDFFLLLQLLLLHMYIHINITSDFLSTFGVLGIYMFSGLSTWYWIAS